MSHEIITNIKNTAKPANVVIKMDMEKVHDRVDWRYFMKVLEKIGFDNQFVDIIWRVVPNNWYSLLINGQDHGIFHSTRLMKQGDLLSPALFILSVEVP